SNWNDKTFQIALNEFPFLRLFDGRIVSGEVKLAKPDPEIFKLLLTTFDLNPRETFFVDDVMKNVEAARAQGIEAVQFTTPKALEDALTAYGVYPELDESEDDGAQSGCGGSCTCHSR
ncbi:MAG TPA: HAD-IA family hydrolase, partial [Alphaproteobacteria bacterium]|nr:HAD-IA family hydrolase [Alphaproteobacteria bacterium]